MEEYIEVIKEYIKENLKVDIEKEYIYDYYSGDSVKVIVSMYLDDEQISTSYIYLD